MGRNAASNFAQYGLPRPEMVRSDALAPAFRELPDGFFDAIITDPPYGIRAGARKPGGSDESREQWLERRSAHQSNATNAALTPPAQEGAATTPSLQMEDTDALDAPAVDAKADDADLNEELLDLAARHLVVGGRLVYLLPAAADVAPDQLPRHPLLRCVSSSVEPLSFAFCRIIVTMEKVAPYSRASGARESYRAACLAGAAATSSVGAGARQRMCELLNAWYASKTSLPAASSTAPELDEGREGHAGSAGSRRSQKADAKRLYRQARHFARLEQRASAADPSACKSAAESVAAAEVGAGQGAAPRLTRKERSVVQAREAEASGRSFTSATRRSTCLSGV